jgi:hypothetical protein
MKVAVVVLAVIALGVANQVRATDEYWGTDGTPGA